MGQMNQPAYEYIHHGGAVKTKWEYPYTYDPIRHFHTRGRGEVESCYSDRMQTWNYKKWQSCVQSLNEGYGSPQSWSFESAVQAQEFLRRYYDAPGLVLLDLVEWCNLATGYALYSFSFIRVVDDSKPLSAALSPAPKHFIKHRTFNSYGVVLGESEC